MGELNDKTQRAVWPPPICNGQTEPTPCVQPTSMEPAGHRPQAERRVGPEWTARGDRGSERTRVGGKKGDPMANTGFRKGHGVSR